MGALSIKKSHFKFIKWPMSPKVKETHLKIIYKIYPVADFLKKRFKFEVDPCAFCELADETLEHMFFFFAPCLIVSGLSYIIGCHSRLIISLLSSCHTSSFIWII